MTKIEEGLVTWGDLKKVNKVRKTYVRATSNPSSSQVENSNTSNKKGSRKPRPGSKPSHVKSIMRVGV